MLKQILILFLFCLLVFSCATKKDEYVLTSITVNQLRKPFTGKEFDSIELIKFARPLNKSFFEVYRHERKNALSGILVSHVSITWLEKQDAWYINDEDLAYMEQQINIQKSFVWQPSKITSHIKFISTIDTPIFTDAIVEDQERIRRIKKEQYIFDFSFPVFNKQKNVAIVSYFMPLLPGAGNIYIYKKDKTVWKIIAHAD